MAMVSVMVALGAAEMAFRVMGLKGDVEPWVSYLIAPDGAKPLDFGFIPQAVIRTLYPENDQTRTVDHRFNSVGWRDVEHSLIKPPDTYRILGLGDSYLFGQGVGRDAICLTRLSEMLSGKSPPGIRVEAINTGLSDYDTVRERDLLVNRGLAYSPDLVIVHFVLNDVERDVRAPGHKPKLEIYTDYLSTHMKPGWLSGHSTLWAWTRQRVLRHFAGRQYIRESLDSFSRNPAKWARTRAALADMHRICAERQIGFLVVIFPFFCHLDRGYPFEGVHALVREFCEREGMAVLDLKEAFREFHGPELWVHPLDPHPNETAHRIAAEAMFEFLTAHDDAIDLYMPR